MTQSNSMEAISIPCPNECGEQMNLYENDATCYCGECDILFDVWPKDSKTVKLVRVFEQVCEIH